MPNRMGTLFLIALVMAGGAVEATRVSNDKVVVIETSLAPGEAQSIGGERPLLLVFLEPGTLEISSGPENLQTRVVSGNVSFEPARERTLKNAGASSVRFVRIDFRGSGVPGMWGAAGLSPHYKVLLENEYARVYDIRIPAGTREPQHTHRARVVVCLSGADLRHLMPDGREEPSTLRTGEIVWRPGGTHIGQNVGTTDLWAIAIEPK